MGAFCESTQILSASANKLKLASPFILFLKKGYLHPSHMVLQQLAALGVTSPSSVSTQQLNSPARWQWCSQSTLCPSTQPLLRTLICLITEDFPGEPQSIRNLTQKCWVPGPTYYKKHLIFVNQAVQSVLKATDSREGKATSAVFNNAQ